MADGWISLNRKIQEHWLFTEERVFSKYEAWIDLLLQANFKDSSLKAGNEIITVKRGSFVTSELKLMERWKWSKTKLRSFLKLLEQESMIEKTSDTKKTTINIVNYSVYQQMETTKEPEKNQKKTNKKLQKDCKKTERKPQRNHKETTEELQKDFKKTQKNKENKENNVVVVDSDQQQQQNIIQYFADNMGTLPSPIIAEELCNWLDIFPSDVIIKAIKEAVKAEARNYKYVERILQSWEQSKLTTVSLVEGHLREWQEKKDKKNRNQDSKVFHEIEHIPDGNEIVKEICKERMEKGLPLPELEGPFNG